jgi:UDP-glucose 4-epimerase
VKILITGGAGFIGSHIGDKLAEMGNRVIIVDDLSAGKEENINPQASFYKLDIRDRESLERVFAQEQPEIVNHHAAQTDVRRSMQDPIFDAQVNVLGSINVIDLSLKYRVRKVIFASTSAVYPEPKYLPADERHPINPLSAYGISKYTTEHYLHLYFDTYGLRYTTFRYGNVYGPRQYPDGEAGVVAIFSEQMLSGVQPTIFGDGSKTRDYVNIDDIVRANMLVMEGLGDGQVFNLGWAREVTDFEVFDAVRKAVGVEVEPVYDKKRPGEVERICLDSSKAKARLNWSPRIILEEGIPLTVEYYRQQHGLR